MYGGTETDEQSEGQQQTCHESTLVIESAREMRPELSPRHT